jgi:hypothetical protein
MKLEIRSSKLTPPPPIWPPVPQSLQTAVYDVGRRRMVFQAVAADTRPGVTGRL